jgi:hypothetical protein
LLWLPCLHFNRLGLLLNILFYTLFGLLLEQDSEIKHSSVSAIIAEEDRKQAILKHQQDLRDLITRWQSQLWLPPPWRWDVTNLDFVLYTGINNSGNRYKLIEQLLDGETSLGHIRNFGQDEGTIVWNIKAGGTIEIEVPVEKESLYKNLPAHTGDSPTRSLFTKWKQNAGEYLWLCSSLLARIQQDAQRAIGPRSELNWWSIYHDAFCIDDTKYHCEICGSQNTGEAKFCKNCGHLLGFLSSVLKQYEISCENSQLSPIHIHGWGNIEETVSIGKFSDIIPAHKELVKKYRGCDLVETILESKKNVKLGQRELIQALDELSAQKVFPGKCPDCKNLII